MTNSPPCTRCEADELQLTELGSLIRVFGQGADGKLRTMLGTFCSNGCAEQSISEHRAEYPDQQLFINP